MDAGDAAGPRNEYVSARTVTAEVYALMTLIVKLVYKPKTGLEVCISRFVDTPSKGFDLTKVRPKDMESEPKKFPNDGANVNGVGVGNGVIFFLEAREVGVEPQADGAVSEILGDIHSKIKGRRNFGPKTS